MKISNICGRRNLFLSFYLPVGNTLELESVSTLYGSEATFYQYYMQSLDRLSIFHEKKSKNESMAEEML